MCHYTHLTPFEREKILFFLAVGKSITEIAHLLSRSKSTISRELRRNAAPSKQSMPYYPLAAQARYRRHRAACRPHKRLENASLRSFVQICILQYHWSPEEIVGRIKMEHGCRLISVPTIYRAVRAGLLNPAGTSAKFVLRRLLHHGKRRHKKGAEERRGKFIISHPIEERPASAEKRTVRGH
ncbi:IS30 family transposase [Mitsuokella multacida]|uniref:IS30 family transposase n=1 Tax=Mitsuokella multacida TaxID=52226 RepID=UPI00242FEBD7|nr:IS30 family transposase [Mitsuokella multacida]